MIQPKETDKDWLNNFFSQSLRASAPYSLEKDHNISTKLDQNENPFDWPIEVKRAVTDRMIEIPWNRYPDPFSPHLNQLIGNAIGAPSDCILTGPGSNHQITLIFDTIGPNLKGKMVIARPSFALFETQCRYSNIPYETWDLNNNLEYDLDSLPDLPAGSFLVFASPNNPTGSSLPFSDLQTILRKNPESLVLADEAYFEFSDGGYQELLTDHSNLLILRTLSKTMGAAGLRMGYILGSKAIVAQLSKRRLPYLLNHFATIATEVMLTHPMMRTFLATHIKHVKTERERVFASILPWAEKAGHRLKKSEANFILLRCRSQNDCQVIYEALKAKGIIVRNISRGPMLEGCLRISIGTKEENDTLIHVISGL